MAHSSLFSSHGLEPTAGQVWAALVPNTEHLASKAARAAGVDPKTARAHLPRLVDCGLAVARTAGKRTYYTRTPEPDLEAVAEVLGIEASVAAKQE